MILNPPFCITSRLLPGLQFGAGGNAGWISIEYARPDYRTGRTRYRYYIDTSGGLEFCNDDLLSGYGGGSLQAGMESFLAFLGAAIESRMYRMHTSRSTPDPNENEMLFPPHVLDWAEQHADEISMAQFQIGETPRLIQE